MRTVLARTLALTLATAGLLVATPAPPSGAVSPGINGTVYYTSTGSNNLSSIVARHPNGTQRTLTQTTDTNQSNSDPAISPDGQRIAYVRSAAGSQDIWIMDSDGGNKQQLTFSETGSGNTDPSFSPDGRHIVFVSLGYIWRMNVDGSRKVQLTSNSPTADNDPEYSPDGRSIAFARTYTEVDTMGVFTFYSDIFRVDADGSNPVQLAPHPAVDASPSWSPDGQRIVFSSNRAGSNEIYRVDATGSGLTRLTNHPATDVDPAYSPDGQQIVFSSDRAAVVQYDLYSMTATGASVTALVVTGGGRQESQPTWGPAHVECQGRAATIAGTNGNDTLKGTPGPDVIAGLGGNDLLQGFDGADVFCGGAGDDTVTYADHELGVTANLGGGTGDDGSAEDGPLGDRDSIGKDVENLVGGFGDDDVDGSSAVNSLTGGPGDDRLNSGSGGDVLLGGSGDDVLLGGDGNEFLIAGESGDDVLRGGDGTDPLLGGSGDDDLFGGEGSDFLEGGLDADTLNGGPGPDTAGYTDRTIAVTASIGGGTGDDGSRQDGPIGDRDTITNSIENLFGGSGGDTLTGNGDDNQITGGLGADTMFGLAGTDKIFALDGVKDLRIDCGADNDYAAQRDTAGVVDPTAASCTGAVVTRQAPGIRAST